jgi:hypothetical protein
METLFLKNHLLKRISRTIKIIKKILSSHILKQAIRSKQNLVPQCHQKVTEATNFRIRPGQMYLAKMIQRNIRDESMSRIYPLK